MESMAAASGPKSGGKCLSCQRRSCDTAAARHLKNTHVPSDFDFELPELLIAQHPAPRSSSRLLDGRQSPPTDRIFRELPGLLQPGDLVVFNDTKVVKARVFGEKASGGKLELLIERALTGNEVVAHMKVSKSPRRHHPHGRRAPRGGFDATCSRVGPTRTARCSHFALHGPAGESAWELMERHGHPPLPPYIERQQNAATTRRGRGRRALPDRVRAPLAPWPRPRRRCISTPPCWRSAAARRRPPTSPLHVGAAPSSR